MPWTIDFECGAATVYEAECTDHRGLAFPDEIAALDHAIAVQVAARKAILANLRALQRQADRARAALRKR